MHAGFFSIEELAQLEMVELILKKYIKKSKDSVRIKYELVRMLIKFMIDDLIENTKINLQKYKIKTSQDIEHQKKKLFVSVKK